MELKRAVREKVKLKIGMFGPSGSGKTYSAIPMAIGLAGSIDKVAIIDTENNSAKLYVDKFGDFFHIDFKPPYSPDRYIEAIDACLAGGIECIIIDSITHEWSGSGGELEIVNSFGGKFTDWSKVAPKRKKFLDKLLQCDAHVICTGRVKTDYAIEKNERGKNEPRKVGLKVETKEGFEYELTLSFRLNQEHYATADKDRTSLFMDKDPFIITEETGKVLKNWCEKGIDVFNFQNEPHRNWLKEICKSENIESEETWKALAGKMQGLEKKPEILKGMISQLEMPN